MQTIDVFADAARARHSIKSDRQLSLRLGLSAHAVTQWRTRRAWPSDDTMIRVAELAGMDTGQALLDLNRWRATTPAVQSAYERIAAKIAGAAAVLTFVTLVTLGSGRPAQASGAEALQATFHNINYAILMLTVEECRLTRHAA